jgi:hypothetical protein
LATSGDQDLAIDIGGVLSSLGRWRNQLTLTGPLWQPAIRHSFRADAFPLGSDHSGVSETSEA